MDPTIVRRFLLRLRFIVAPDDLGSIPTYITIQDAARRVQVTTQTIRNWIGRGLLTGYRAGPREVRVNVLELEMMFEKHPKTKVRDGRKVYGEKAIIKPLPIRVEVTDPEVDR